MLNLSSRKKTYLITISGVVNLFVSSVMLFILGRLILKYFGSDYNGVNSTINQITSILSILEGGFTTASIVALFKPYSEKNRIIVNTILSTSSSAFKKIGLLSFVLGIVLSISYALLIKSNIDFQILIMIFFMSIVGTSFNFYFSLKYQMLFQVNQCEFVINFVYIISNICFQSIAILSVIATDNILVVRLIYMLQTIFQGLAIYFISRKIFPNAIYTEKADFSLIKGTKDVYISKVTSVIYNSSAVFFISMFVGTLYTSVYSVYNLPITLVKNVLYTIINSFQNFIGKLNVTAKREVLLEYFNKYEYFIVIVIFYCFSIMSIIIIPFVRLYTSGVNDVDYINVSLAYLMIFISIFELLHIPSGLVINMTGNFKVSKNIQIEACIILILTIISFSFLAGFMGIIFSTFITSVFLCCREIIYVKKAFFKTSSKIFFKNVFVNAICFFSNLVISYYFVVSKAGNISFFIFIVFASIIYNTLIYFFVNFFFNRKEFINLFHFVYNKFLKRKGEN